MTSAAMAPELTMARRRRLAVPTVTVPNSKGPPSMRTSGRSTRPRSGSTTSGPPRTAQRTHAPGVSDVSTGDCSATVATAEAPAASHSAEGVTLWWWWGVAQGRGGVSV